jgi:hypothetical protein
MNNKKLAYLTRVRTTQPVVTHGEDGEKICLLANSVGYVTHSEVDDGFRLYYVRLDIGGESVVLFEDEIDEHPEPVSKNLREFLAAEVPVFLNSGQEESIFNNDLPGSAAADAWKILQDSYDNAIYVGHTTSEVVFFVQQDIKAVIRELTRMQRYIANHRWTQPKDED